MAAPLPRSVPDADRGVIYEFAIDSLDLILAWNRLLDRYRRLLSQPSADCRKIIFCQVIEIDTPNRAEVR